MKNNQSPKDKSGADSGVSKNNSDETPEDICENCGKTKSKHIPCSTNDEVFWCYDNKIENISLSKAYQMFKPKEAGK